MAPRNVARVEEFFHGMGIKIITWSHYLGGLVGNRKTENIWMAEKVQGWIEFVKTLLGVACKHSQYDYGGLQKSLQQEWAFVQQFTPNTGDSFVLVEQVLRDIFITALYQGLGEGTPGRGITHLPMKQMGLALPDPTKTAPENWTAPCVITGHLVAVLTVQEEYRTTDHSTCL